MAGLISSNPTITDSKDLGNRLHVKCSATGIYINHQMDGNSDVPNTREILGTHLYQKVCECWPSGAENPTLSQKLTGMLMECKTDDLLMMLTQEQLLKTRIAAAKLSLGDNPSQCSANESDEKLNLGNQLFEKVIEIDSALSAQITGMLLELDQITIKELLMDDSKLRQAVDKSKQTFLQHHSLNIEDNLCKHEETTTTCAETGEELGEMLYNIVEKMYPRDAAQITGMLLEVEPVVLQELLEDREHLMQKINMAQNVLHSKQADSL